MTHQSTCASQSILEVVSLAVRSRIIIDAVDCHAEILGLRPDGSEERVITFFDSGHTRGSHLSQLEMALAVLIDNSGPRVSKRFALPERTLDSLLDPLDLMLDLVIGTKGGLQIVNERRRTSATGLLALFSMRRGRVLQCLHQTTTDALLVILKRLASQRSNRIDRRSCRSRSPRSCSHHPPIHGTLIQTEIGRERPDAVDGCLTLRRSVLLVELATSSCVYVLPGSTSHLV